MWNFRKHNQSTALRDDTGKVLAYSELDALGQKLADAAGGRCLIFCLCTNAIGSVLGYTAFIEHHIVPALLSAEIDRELLESLLEAYRPTFVWCPEGYDPGDIGGRDTAGMALCGYKLVRTGYVADYAIHDDLALLLTTSGSTGSPKFVRQSYKNIETNTKQIIEYLQITAEDRPITTLPMNYTYGLSIINTHLAAGAEILLTDKGLMQREFWIFFKEQQATTFGGVPYTYEMLDKLRFMRMALPELRYMTQAGGKLSPELHKKFAEYAIENDKKFIVMYGQCEATARMAYLPAEDALRKYGYMGIAIPDGRFELKDETGSIIPEDQPDMAGELVYYGENVTMGYAQCAEDLCLGDERCGRLETGDMAVRDAEGYFRIVGRKKRFLKIYGNRVNLDETDGLLKKQYPDFEIVCGGVDDRLYVFVKGTGSIDLPSDEMKHFLSEKTGLNPAAFHVIEIEEIPRNDAGKVLYKELEQYYDI